MRILTYVTTQEDEGRAVRSVVPRQFSLGTHAFRRLKARSAILLDGAPVHAGCILRAGQTLQLCLDNGADACPAPSSLIRSTVRLASESMRHASLMSVSSGRLSYSSVRRAIRCSRTDASPRRSSCCRSFSASSSRQAAIFA